MPEVRGPVSLYPGCSDFRERAKAGAPIMEMEEIEARFGTKLKNLT